MSPKGTHPLNVAGSQVLKPRLWARVAACVMHANPEAPNEEYAPMIDGFRPPGRKKFISEASTKGSGPSGPPAGLHPLTVNGLAGVGKRVGLLKATESVMAALKFATIRSPRMVLALMGRFRWRPPVK